LTKLNKSDKTKMSHAVLNYNYNYTLCGTNISDWQCV